MFSYEFSLEPENWLPENRCFVRGLRQFSAHLTKCYAHHAICTLSALTMRFAQNTQHDTSKVLRLPREMTMEVAKVPRLPRTMQLIFLKLTQKYCACHTKRLPTRYETCWTVTKCYACHAKRGYAALETSKSDHFCRTRHRHGHTGPPANGCGRLWTVANGCGRKRNVRRTHPPPPDPQSETGTLDPCYAFGKNHCVFSCCFPCGIWFEEFHSFTHFHTHASHRTWYRATAPEFSAATFVWAETITEQDRAHDLAPWRGLHAFDVWVPCLIYFRTF